MAPGSGPYVDRLVLGAIPGANATNTITFNGGGATLAHPPTVSADRAAILLDGADHVTIDGLTIDGGPALTAARKAEIFGVVTVESGARLARFRGLAPASPA